MTGVVRSKFFGPGRIGPVAVRDCVVMPPMATLADAEGYVADAMIAHFRARYRSDPNAEG
jgi:2,4-dienoyl-CoA reductase-like NADH-dependent reductase (Old Yellow Enzyme family)